jgi:hypothetical protein
MSFYNVFFDKSPYFVNSIVFCGPSNNLQTLNNKKFWKYFSGPVNPLEGPGHGDSVINA